MSPAPPRPARSTRLGILLATLWVWVAFVPIATAANVTDVRTWSSPDRTRVVIDLSGSSDYTVTRSLEPPRLVVDVARGSATAGRATWDPKDKRVRRVSLRGKGSGTRVVIDLTRAAHYKYFDLDPVPNRKPHRIVVDVLRPMRVAAPAKKARPAPRSEIKKSVRAPAKSARKKMPSPPSPVIPVAPVPVRAGTPPFHVMIDAGHGGEDPGATGRYYRTREKDVVLAIARHLKRELESRPGFKVELTRTGDYFVSLGTRVRRANRARADLFISIHADTSRDRRTRGTHVYTLAPRNSRDRRAVRVARMENASDLIGGVESAQRVPVVFDGDGSPNQLVESRVLSRLALGRMRSLNQGGRVGRRAEAGFWVLKGDRPSILVETGFLSSKSDEKALRSDAFRRKLARALADAVSDYRAMRSRPTPFVHVVKRGDSLSRIGQRYGLSSRAIAVANRKRTSAVLHPGERLMIPARAPVGSRGAPQVAAAKPARSHPPTRDVGARASDRSHRVRKGDNLTRIARQYGVRLADLMAVNGVSRHRPLKVNTRLRIPQARADDRVHVVARGESLSSLARTYGVSISRLARVNDLGPRASLPNGRTLIVPDAAATGAGSPARTDQRTVYWVRKGDTLGGVARRFGVPIGRLARANGLGLQDWLRKGQKLRIPGGADGPRRPPPVASVVASTQPVSPSSTHWVRRGETLGGLARKYQVPLAVLAKTNGLTTRSWLRTGQRLAIPADGGTTHSRIHRVAKGESLSGLAQRYHVPLSALAKANGLSTRAWLRRGQALVIPNVTTSARLHAG